MANLIPYARNARTHSAAQVALIAGSIREYGFTCPVLVDGANGIIAGHGRVLAARQLGLTKVPVIALGHLTETQKRDALGDSAYTIDYTSLLDFPPASVRAYSPATVLAEKFQAVVALGIANGRMKDFYDLWALPRAIELDQAELGATIARTFERQRTAIPGARPPGLARAFAADATKSAQWRAYSEATEVEGLSLAQILDDIWTWLEPICAGLRDHPA